MKADDLAPAGFFGDEDKPIQQLANARSRSNSTRYRETGMRRTRRNLKPFLRRMATHPEHITDGNFNGIENLKHSHLLDHIRLYNRNGRPYAAIFHPYSRLDRDTMRALLDWAFEAGLNVCVDADSEYYPGVTLRLVLYREGEDFPATDLA